MIDVTPQSIAFIVGVVALTASAAWTDVRARRIPNVLTVPACLLGLVYQFAFHGWSGLGDAAGAFAVGFGTLLVLWLIGGGGGGDVKLMGALSVWLGLKPTLYVLVISTLFVIVGTFVVVCGSMLKRGIRRTQQKYTAAGRRPRGKPAAGETAAQRRERRIMAYGLPVALATWVVMVLDSFAITGGQLGP